MEKLKFALIYGADAVYCAGSSYGLRSFAKNFTSSELIEGINFAHNMGKKVYITLNIIPHNDDFIGIEEYLKFLQEIKVDALIISDPGMLLKAMEIIPDVQIHLSTQANNTNYLSAKFWAMQGVKRIILARELSLEEIKTIHKKVGNMVQLEAFVHGAMCISYSGRCLISNYLTHRDANRGECTQACRWKYYLMEESRPGIYLPVFEDERGTYIFNSKDLCMIEHIPQLIDAGLVSLKIEGRMKSTFYVATVTKAYRNALDSYYENKDNYVFDKENYNEINKVSNRGFTTAFYFGKPDTQAQKYPDSSYTNEYSFLGIIKDEIEENEYLVEHRTNFTSGEEIEIFGYDIKKAIKTKILQIQNLEGEIIKEAKHPKEIYKVRLEAKLKTNYIMRKAKQD